MLGGMLGKKRTNGGRTKTGRKRLGYKKNTPTVAVVPRGLRSHVLQNHFSTTVTQEIAVGIAFNAGGSTGVYTFDTSTATFTAPVSQINIDINVFGASLSYLSSVKFQELAKIYRYVKRNGVLLEFVSTFISSVAVAGSGISSLPDIAFTVLPFDQTIVLQNTAPGTTPADIFEYEKGLRVQVKNTESKPIGKYFSFKGVPICPKDMLSSSTATSGPVVLANAWNVVDNIIGPSSASGTGAYGDTNVYMGWKFPPLLNVAAANGVDTNIGILRITSYLSFAVPLSTGTSRP